MLRGWEEGPNNPFDDDDAESPPPPPPPIQQGEVANRGSSYDPPEISVDAPAQQDTMYREWDRATQRYQQESSNDEEGNNDESIIEEDPLASPGNSSVNSGYGGWSLGAGMVERTSICQPFDAEDDDEDDDNKSTRSSSPRESQFKTHGLSMVKEEDDSKDDAKTTNENNSSCANNGNVVGKVSMFDDVDLEAFPQNLPTGSSTNETLKDKYTSSSNGDDTNDNSTGVGGWDRGNITKRILHEVRSINPQLKYKALLGFSILLVSSCVIAIAISAASNNNEKNGHIKKKQEEWPVDLTGLLADLESETTTYTGIPSFIPTKFPTESPSLKPTTENPTMKPTNEPTYSDPTFYPTNALTTISPTWFPTESISTLSPSSNPTTTTPTYSPSNPPFTMSPTRDCTDKVGEYMTYNDKMRDCEWLDNGYNGAKSTRKELNCLTSEIGNACKYTCRLYNGCMGYLLDILPEYTNENDISIGSSSTSHSINDETTPPCEDMDGFFVSNGNVPRECSWIEEDNELAPAKKNLNCGTPAVPPTELGIMCRASCAGYNDCKPHGTNIHPLSGLNNDEKNDDSDHDSSPTPTVWSTNEPTTVDEREYLTHMGTYRACRWFNRDNIEEKLEKNCGITPIGMNCVQCGVDIISPKDGQLEEKTVSFEQIVDGNGETFIPTLSPSIGPPTPHPASKGVFDESGKILTLTTLSDASVSAKYPDENDGVESKRLNVAHDPDNGNRERQALLLYDLGFVAKSLDVVSLAKLRIYLTVGSDTTGGGVALKKMAYTNWSENKVTWNNIPGGDGADEPIVAFVDSLDSDTWYDIDVTAAVKDALENNESKLGIRIVADEGDLIDIYFASKDRVKEAPTLIIDSRTGDPTYQPTEYPTYVPSASPTYTVDCMDRKGKFTTHTGEREPCSWLNVGNGSLKKSFNCQDATSEAAMFCQASCSEYNGCDDLHCTDMGGEYESHIGWKQECSWLLSGQGTLKLEMNCGGGENSITELGKRCQKTCGEYNECGSAL